MILPDKLDETYFDVNLTEVDGFKLSDEIIKRYNDYTRLEDSLIQTGKVITRYSDEEDKLRQENKELKAEINSLSRDSLGNMQDAIKAEQQYNKLRDAIKDKIELHKVWDDKQVVAVLESIIDKVENEK